ncbi:MAG: VWA domain-containing protein [Pyrinomonadaceae bacterium]
MRRFFFITLLLFLLSISAFAQIPSSTPPVADDDSIKISTNLIQIDVTVTDKDGKIVTDLKPEDFEVFENGKKQDLTNFSFITVNPQTNKLENTAQQKSAKNQISVPLPPVKLKQEEVRRTYAIVVDDLGISFDNVGWVKQNLRKFISERMQEGDLVAIIRTGTGIGALQSFTSDKKLLLAAIEKIRWNPQGRGGIGSFDPITPTFKEQMSGETADGGDKNITGQKEDAEFEKQIEETRTENFSVGSLGAISYVIRGMRDLPGRKSLMLISEGFPIFSKGGGGLQNSNRIFDQMRVLADLANRSSVVLYTLDPRGLINPLALEAADNTFRMSAEQIEQRLNTRNDSLIDTQQSLRFLAYQTGGFPFVNQNDLGKGLRKAVDDQNSYYLLGYQPDAETFDLKKNKFNKLEVKVNRPDLKVRYRSGFFGISDEKYKQTVEERKTPQQRLVDALISPFGADEINLDLYSIFYNDEQNRSFIHSILYIDPNDLTFTNDASDGLYHAKFDVAAMIFDSNGAAAGNNINSKELKFTKEQFSKVRERGIIYDLPISIVKTGAYQFRIALIDAASRKIGAASQFIEVPNLKKNKLTLSGLVLQNFTPGEWKSLPLGQKQVKNDRSAYLDTAVRRFNRGTILRANYVIYNLEASKTQLPRLELQTRLIRDGKVVFEGSPTPYNASGQNDLQRLQASTAITLGNNLEAGNYVLQVIVFDNSNDKKAQFVTQFVEFEIVQ